MKYGAVIEKASRGYSAYAPDLPGCVAAGDSRAEAGEMMREAVIPYLESLRECGDPVPEPQTSAALVEV